MARKRKGGSEYQSTSREPKHDMMGPVTQRGTMPSEAPFPRVRKMAESVADMWTKPWPLRSAEGKFVPGTQAWRELGTVVDLDAHPQTGVIRKAAEHQLPTHPEIHARIGHTPQDTKGTQGL